MNGATELYRSGGGATATAGRRLTLLDLLDRLLGGGVVIQGRITLAVAEIDLIDLDLAVLVASHDKVASR